MSSCPPSTPLPLHCSRRLLFWQVTLISLVSGNCLLLVLRWIFLMSTAVLETHTLCPPSHQFSPKKTIYCNNLSESWERREQRTFVTVIIETPLMNNPSSLFPSFSYCLGARLSDMPRDWKVRASCWSVSKQLPVFPLPYTSHPVPSTGSLWKWHDIGFVLFFDCCVHFLLNFSRSLCQADNT